MGWSLDTVTVLSASIERGLRDISKDVPEHWKKDAEKLVLQCKHLYSEQRIPALVNEYVKWLYGLLLEHPRALKDRYSLMPNGAPIDPSNSDLLWRLVKKYNPIARGKKQFRDNLGHYTLLALLSSGEERAFDYCYRQILKNLVVPSQRVCYSFRDYLYVVSNGQLSNSFLRSRSTIGQEWEKLCRTIARLKYGDIIVHPKLPNGKIPDIIPIPGCEITGKHVTYASRIIECKRSVPSVDEFVELLEKYTWYCDELDIWVLTKGRDDNWLDGLQDVNIVSAERLCDGVSQELFEKIQWLTANKKVAIEDTKLIVDTLKSVFPDDKLERVIELNLFLMPYYRKYDLLV